MKKFFLPLLTISGIVMLFLMYGTSSATTQTSTIWLGSEHPELNHSCPETHYYYYADGRSFNDITFEIPSGRTITSGLITFYQIGPTDGCGGSTGSLCSSNLGGQATFYLNGNKIGTFYQGSAGESNGAYTAESDGDSNKFGQWYCCNCTYSKTLSASNLQSGTNTISAANFNLGNSGWTEIESIKITYNYTTDADEGEDENIICYNSDLWYSDDAGNPTEIYEECAPLSSCRADTLKCHANSIIEMGLDDIHTEIYATNATVAVEIPSDYCGTTINTKVTKADCQDPSILCNRSGSNYLWTDPDEYCEFPVAKGETFYFRVSDYDGYCGDYEDEHWYIHTESVCGDDDDTDDLNDFGASLGKSIYTDDDDGISITITFPEGTGEFDARAVLYDACGRDVMENTYIKDIYNNSSSPTILTVPIRNEIICHDSEYCWGDPYPPSGDYTIELEIWKMSGDNKLDTVYLTSLDLVYNGLGEDVNCAVCGNNVCETGENCKADNCCKGKVVDRFSDPNNCGDCGNTCYITEECIGGVCIEQEEEPQCISEECLRAKECAGSLSALEACLMEIIDIIPYIDKPAAVSLLAEDICELKERIESSDHIGSAITAVLTAIDLADNAADFYPGLGNVISASIDTVEGAFDCLEGIIYQYYVKPVCGVYTLRCVQDIATGIALFKMGYNIAVHAGRSPIVLDAVDNFGSPLGGINGILTFNEPGFNTIIVINPENITNGYNVEITGTDSGTYTLETAIISSSGEVKKELKQENIAITSGQKNYYKVQVPKSLDPNGIYMAETEIEPPHPEPDITAFYDLPASHWAYGYVMELAAFGIIRGYEDSTFRPEQPITRAELLKIIMEGLNISTDVSGENTFYDVMANDWFYKYVVAGRYHGIIEGYLDNTFRPNQNINRAEALKIVLEAAGIDVSNSPGVMTYIDVDYTAWYGNYVAYATNYGIVSGYGDFTFKPGNSITRAEASKIVNLVMNYTAQ